MSTQARAAALVGAHVARLWTVPEGVEAWFIGAVASYRQAREGESSRFMVLVCYDDGDTEDLPVSIPRPLCCALAAQ